MSIAPTNGAPRTWVVYPDGRSSAPDLDEAARAASVLFDPDGAHELRSLPAGKSRLVRASDPDGLMAAVAALSDGKGVYYTLNPVRPDLGDRAARVADILRRRWFGVDVDRHKPPGESDSSATDAEKSSARTVTAAIVADLAGRGWPTPVLVDSGNGFHLLFRVELPCDDLAQSLLRECLRALGSAHDTDEAKVDRAVHNAARIFKLPGTWARKGPDTAERPHRMARLLLVPERLEVVPADLLHALSGVPLVATTADAPARESPWSVAATNREPDRLGAYVRSAVELELARVALAPVGDRNNALNRAAFALGTLLQPGMLDREAVALRLAFAAQRAGLVTSEVAATIRSGLDAGAKSPRELPDLSAPARPATPGPATVAGPPAPGGPPECVKAIVERLSDVDPKEVEWLFPNRIPLGKITLIAGDQGLGKSFLTMDLIARVTTGGEVPCGDGECVADGSAVLLSAEDGLADTIRPRLDAAGADCRRVFALTTLELPDGRLTPFTLAYIPQLEATITGAPDCKLVVIDPVGAYVGGVDDHKGATLRAVLGPLSSLAERTNVAIVLVTHLNKGGGTRALQRVTGSLVYTALARAAWLIVRDKDDPGRRLMLSIKNNLAPDPSGLAYRITADRRVEWEGETIRMTANEALARDQEDEAPAPKRRRRAEDAADWLAAQFPDGMGVPSKEILARGKAAGFSRDALFEAKKELGIGARKQPGGDGGWAWFAAPADPSRGQESDGSPPFNACDS